LGWWLCLAACGSVNQSEFTGEMAIHFTGLKNIDKPAVWVFPRIVVCLDCGTAEFAVPKLNCVSLYAHIPSCWGVAMNDYGVLCG
jgi:hypothetical protein